MRNKSWKIIVLFFPKKSEQFTPIYCLFLVRQALCQPIEEQDESGVVPDLNKLIL